MRVSSIPAIIGCAVGVSGALSFVRPANAFVKACHQGITNDVLDGAAWPLGATSPTLSPDYIHLKNELTIDVPAKVDSLWTLSALIGNQYNDGGSFDAKDIVALAEYAAKPDGQREHCLRSTGDDGVDGDAHALAACKGYILEQIGGALGDGDAPDLEATETVRLHLVFRGNADIPVARFGFHLGQATHALQDAFTHTFRSPDKRQVRTVLNWVDWLKGKNGYDVARDGFQHVMALDNCAPSDTGGLERRMAAQQATTELVAAVADDQGGRAGRIARAGAVIDAWFGLDGTCTAGNDWCDAPEKGQVSATGCRLAPAQQRRGGSRTGEAAGAFVAAALMLALRTRRQPPSQRRRRPAALSIGALVGALVGPLALGTVGVAAAADDAKAAETEKETEKKTEKAKQDDAGKEHGQDGERGEHKGNVVKKASPEQQQELESHPFGVIAGGGVSLDNAGYNFGIGARYDLNKQFTVGLDVDYNPWLSIETKRTAGGTTNIFAVGIYRLDVRDYLELRATIAAGASVLMFDTWAAKQGSVGPYFAISPLGIAIRMSSHLRLVVDPAELVVAIPQTTGIPLVHRQHRFSIAAQFNF
ncbi:MAG TPA: hypothetical protein VFH73_10555 [Polyangia bacterium]|jgi:hypothetical protein|nr:hypothetical protein [Polyangia bacterium]